MMDKQVELNGKFSVTYKGLTLLIAAFALALTIHATILVPAFAAGIKDQIRTERAAELLKIERQLERMDAKIDRLLEVRR